MLISSEPFLVVCRAMTEMGGISAMRWAVVEHPLGSASDEELRAKAKSATDQFIDVVLGRQAAAM